MNIHAEKSKDGLTVRLCSEINTFGDVEWSVALSDSVNTEIEICDGEYQAHHHFRRVCTTIGIPMPYQAPQFETPVTRPTADSTDEAVATYYTYHGKLSQTYPGSEKAKSIFEKMLTDPEFQRHAREIFALTPKSNNWIINSIRVACKRIEARKKAEENRQLHEVPGFGGF